jgi:hypothetical protein
MGLDMMLVHDGDQIVSWRKANAIHKWFVDNVQDGVDDCGEYKVTKEQLIRLRNVCNDVLGDGNLASELLPTQSGFFFGDTEYDTWYFKDLANTVQFIDEIFEYKSYCLDDLYYSSSW